MTELIAVPKIAQWQKLKDARARQCPLADHETRVQHGAGRVLQLVPTGASSEFLVNGEYDELALLSKRPGYRRVCGGSSSVVAGDPLRSYEDAK
jgi:hypothetical protein